MTSEKTGSEITAEAMQDFEDWKDRFDEAANRNPDQTYPAITYFDTLTYIFIYYEQFKAVDKATAPLLARIAELEKQVEAARAGLKELLDTAIKIRNSYEEFTDDWGYCNQRVQAYQNAYIRVEANTHDTDYNPAPPKATTTDPADLPTMMSLWCIGKPLDQ